MREIKVKVTMKDKEELKQEITKFCWEDKSMYNFTDMLEIYELAGMSLDGTFSQESQEELEEFGKDLSDSIADPCPVTITLPNGGFTYIPISFTESTEYYE